MHAFGVRRDRAEVMGVAAIVLVDRRSWLRLRANDHAARRRARRLALRTCRRSKWLRPCAYAPSNEHSAQVMLAGAESFAYRVRCDLKHAEQVRLLALQLFDKLWPYHHLDFEARTHSRSGRDPARFRRAHQSQGPPSPRRISGLHNAKIPGLRGWAKNMTACLVRYHNKKSEPSAKHNVFASLDRQAPQEQRAFFPDCCAWPNAWKAITARPLPDSASRAARATSASTSNCATIPA